MGAYVASSTLSGMGRGFFITLTVANRSKVKSRRGK